MSSTQIVELVQTSTSASITYVVLIEIMKKRNRDTFFFRQGMGLPYVFKVSVWTIVITNGLIKVCKTIKESILMPNAGPSS